MNLYCPLLVGFCLSQSVFYRTVHCRGNFVVAVANVWNSLPAKPRSAFVSYKLFTRRIEHIYLNCYEHIWWIILHYRNRALLIIIILLLYDVCVSVAEISPTAERLRHCPQHQSVQEGIQDLQHIDKFKLVPSQHLSESVLLDVLCALQCQFEKQILYLLPLIMCVDAPFV